MKKNSRKKMLAIVLAVVMISSLTGCKKTLPEDEEVFTGSGAKTVEEMVPEKGAKLVFWTSNKEYGEGIAKAFEAKYGVPVTVAQEGMGTVDKIALSGPSGEGADVFITGHDNFQKGLSSGVFMELEQAIVDNVTSKVTESGIQTVMNDGKMYGVPISIEVNCLFYNKDLVEAPATTLEEIMEGAKTFNDPANNKFNFLCTIGDGYYEFPFVSAEGFELFGPDGDDGDNPGFDTDEYEKGLELIASLHDTMPISSTDLNNKSSLKANFIEGNVALRYGKISFHSTKELFVMKRSYKETNIYVVINQTEKVQLLPTDIMQSTYIDLLSNQSLDCNEISPYTAHYFKSGKGE